MKDFFRLIRWSNLLIIAVTLILIRYSVILPLLQNEQANQISSNGVMLPMALHLPLTLYILLITATILIAGAGYIINDYFDIKTDLINRGEIIVGTKISRRWAMMWHNILNAAGVAIGFFISWKAGYFFLGTLFLLVSGLLYFYSARYKRRFLIGNLIVASLTAMVPMLVVIFDATAIHRYYIMNAIPEPDTTFLFMWVGGFSLFAFLTTLSREIIKDIEDYEGDIEYGRKTLPIVLGIRVTKMLVVSLQILTILLLYTFLILYLNNLFSVIYLTAFVALPLILVIFLLLKSNTRKQFHIVSRLMKVIMITGVLFTILIKYILL